MDALLILSSSILCQKEALGEIFPASIAGINASIHFPRLPEILDDAPEIGISNPLLPPEIAITWGREDKQIHWGYPQSYPSKNGCVEALAVSFNCTAEEEPEANLLLQSNIRQWEQSLVDFLQIATGQNTERDKNKKNITNCRLIFHAIKGSYPFEAYSIYCIVPGEDSFASATQISEAIKFASSGKELLLEYQMMISAYESRKNCQNRQAIIDACCAVELHLDQIIKSGIQNLGMEPNIFLDKYRSLGDKFDLVKQLEPQFPNADHQGIIVKPRNDIAHNREINPTDEATDRLITCIEDCLKYAFEGYY